MIFQPQNKGLDQKPNLKSFNNLIAFREYK